MKSLVNIDLYRRRKMSLALFKPVIIIVTD